MASFNCQVIRPRARRHYPLGANCPVVSLSRRCSRDYFCFYSSRRRPAPSCRAHRRDAPAAVWEFFSIPLLVILTSAARSVTASPPPPSPARSNAQWDYYTNVVCYIIRTNDILADGTVRATARDIAVILQNDTPSASTNEQGVNTEVSIPGIKIGAQCVPSVGENGVITYIGTVTNSGNNTLFNVTDRK